MSAPVHVLKFLDHMIQHAELKLGQHQTNELRKVRDEIAELLEAANGPICHPDFDTRTKANLRLAHALLRAEGRTP